MPNPTWGSRSAFRRLALAGALFIAALAAWTFLQWGGGRATQAVVDLALVLLPLAAGCAALATAGRTSGHVRRGWMLLGTASLSWGLGGAAWAFYELVEGRDVPFPSVADAGYLGFIPFAVLGLAALGSLRGRNLIGWRTLLDGILSAACLLFATWPFLLGPSYEQGSGSLAERAIGLAYPLGDIILATMCVLVASRAHRGDRAPLALALLGVVAIALSDSAFAYLNLVGAYETGSLADAGWMAGFALLGLAAAHPSAPGVAVDETRVRPTIAGLALPYTLVAMAGAVAAYVEVAGSGLDGFLFWTGAVIVLSVLARQLVALIENAWLNRSIGEAYGELRASEQRRVVLVESVSHDLGNILSPMQLHADLLSRGADPLSEDQRRTLASMDRNLHQFARLVRDLADVARLEGQGLQISFSSVRLSDVAGSAVEAFREEARLRGVTLELDLEERVTIEADGDRLAQVLYNLVSNSLKFTPRGGRIRVVGALKGDEAHLEVLDTGRGLDGSEIGRLFQPFSQVHARGEIPERGSGLGLYICKGIVEGHGGTIRAESAGLGHGTCVRIRLPVARPSVRQVQPPARASLAAQAVPDDDR